jgi:glucose-1-phosphate thymidylyltransferase
MKGIILAGGSGTRLHPMTITTCKQLLPIYDKPMIFYPLTTLIHLNITEILIITTPADQELFKNLLGDGGDYGIKLSYAIQDQPKGLAESMIIGEEFIGNDSVALILGDNIFYGSDFTNSSVFKNITNLNQGASILAYHVEDPQRYGVVDFDENDLAINLEEKPKHPKSNWAVTGLYFYDNNAAKYAKTLKPSNRGEIEITDLNRIYLENNQLTVKRLERGFTWLDTGTPESLLDAAQFVQTIQHRQGLKIACIEEICYIKNLINSQQLEKLAKKYKPNNEYGKYLRKVLDNSGPSNLKQQK